VFYEEKGTSIKTAYYYRQKKVRGTVCIKLLEKQNCKDGLAESRLATDAENALIIEDHIQVTASTSLKPLAKVYHVLRVTVMRFSEKVNFP